MPTDLRSRQHEATRRAILDATQRMVVEEHGWLLSMSEVAERAGVSRRTLYRYFATKDALLEAASEEWADGGAAEVHDLDFSADDLDGVQRYLVEQWGMLAANVPGVLAQHASPAGREVRARWLPRARRMSRAALAGLELSDEDLRELADVLIATMSSTMFLELVDRMDHDPERAARLTAWVVASLLDRVRADGGIELPLDERHGPAAGGRPGRGGPPAQD